MEIKRQQSITNFGMSINNIDKKSISKNLGEAGIAIVERADRRLKVLYDDSVELTIKGTNELFGITKALKVTATMPLGKINGKVHNLTSSFKLWLKPLFYEQEALNYGNLIKGCENLFIYNPKVEKQLEKFNKISNKNKVG